MDEQKIIQSFTDYLKGKGFDEKSLSLDFLPDLFIDYYREIEFAGLDKEKDDDMLHFGYGVYNWGDGDLFLIHFTRQLIERFGNAEHRISQLIVNLFYESENFEDVGIVSKWSHYCENMEEFLKTITESSGYQKALGKQLVKKEIIVDLV